MWSDSYIRLPAWLPILAIIIVIITATIGVLAIVCPYCPPTSDQNALSISIPMPAYFLAPGVLLVVIVGIWAIIVTIRRHLRRWQSTSDANAKDRWECK